MSVTLAIFSFPGANECMARHSRYFFNQEADSIYGIGTTDGRCQWPQGIKPIDVGIDNYIDGPHLPLRMLDTMDIMLLLPWRQLILAEYDTLFFKPIPAEDVKTVAACMAGGQTWGSKATWFAHNPWVFARETAIAFVKAGREAIAGGICPGRGRGNPSTPECSPDVFFGYVCETARIPVHFNLWREYSRNDLEIPTHLDEARDAYRKGFEVVHGCKTKEQLEYIISES